MNRPHMFSFVLPLRDLRRRWCPLGSYQPSSLMRLRWYCPCLHKQLNFKLCQDLIGLGTTVALASLPKGQPGIHQNVGGITEFHLFCFLSLCPKSFCLCKVQRSIVLKTIVCSGQTNYVTTKHQRDPPPCHSHSRWRISSPPMRTRHTPGERNLTKRLPDSTNKTH